MLSDLTWQPFYTGLVDGVGNNDMSQPVSYLHVTSSVKFCICVETVLRAYLPARVRARVHVCVFVCTPTDY